MDLFHDDRREVDTSNKQISTIRGDGHSRTTPNQVDKVNEEKIYVSDEEDFINKEDYIIRINQAKHMRRTLETLMGQVINRSHNLSLVHGKVNTVGIGRYLPC